MSYRRSLLLLVAATACLQVLVIIVADLDRPPWGDEAHFVQTVRLFGQEPTFQTLRTYPEMSGPLPFAMYAMWGTIAGLDLRALRLLSLVVAFLSYLLLHRLAWRLFQHGTAALLVALFFAVHPYTIGFSIFVFTDGPAMCFVLLTLLGAHRRQAWLVGIGLAAALLCRQYLAFLIPPVVGWAYLLQENREEKRAAMQIATTAILSTAPLVALFVLWRGVAPDNDVRTLYLSGGLAFHPDYLVMYISLLFYYLMPVVVYARRKVYGTPWMLAAAAVCALVYWIWPVEASPFAQDIGVATVGLFHKGMVGAGLPPWLIHTVFFAGFALGLPIVLHSAGEVVRQIRHGHARFPAMLDLCLIAFLIVMPFSYLNWEKYLMPLVPILALRLAAWRLMPADER